MSNVGRRILLARVGLAAVAATLLAQPSAGQSRSTAALRGNVLQEDGSAVVGAIVEVRDERTGATRQVLTGPEGRFLILQLQAGGPYTLRVRALGFGEREVAGLQLQAGDAFPIEVVMGEEALRIEGIEVSVDPAAVFGVNQIGPATRIDQRTIDAMPVLSRNIMELTVLSPLVRTTEGGGFSIAGQNDRYNAILVDGQFSKDMFGLTAGGLPGGQAGAKLIPIDAVAQYEILVAPYDVRLTGFTGGVMNAVTRSGTNQWRARVDAVHRNEALIGDLSLPTGPVDASTVDRSLIAASFGGPIVRDRVHIFAAGEFERQRRPPNGFNLFRDDPALVRISEESVGEISEFFESNFGVDPGEAGIYPLKRELANTFTRVDFNFDGGDRLTMRHIFAHASNDDDPNRQAFQPYEFSSNAVSRQSTSHIVSAQYFRRLSERFANELAFTLHRSVDRTIPSSSDPQFEVGLISSIEGASYLRYSRMGGQFFAQVNDLEQTSLRVSNSVDMTVGDDVVTMGVSGSWLSISNQFLPGANGEYLFASMSDVEANAPFRYQQTVLADGESAAIGFDVAEVGAFVQRQINAGKGLTMHFGLRLDLPFVLGRPDQNIDLQAFFGYNSSVLPSSKLLISPRWGFNWQSSGQRKTQVRSGAGLFSGQIPYVWLSNAFHDNGLRSFVEVCQGRRTLDPRPSRVVPAYVPGARPAGCEGPAGEVRPFATVRNAVVFDPTFVYPQDLRFSIVVDRELSDRLTGSVGVLFNTAFNQVGLEDINLASGGSAGPDLLRLAGDERRYYSRIANEYDHVLAVTNEGQNVAASLTAELRGNLNDRLTFQLGYSFARTWDRVSLVYRDMLSNLGNNASIANVNNPPLEASNFDRPHKFVATVFGAPLPSFPKTEISLLYTGQSGLPFSYVYSGDVNGDGYPGLGGALDRNNDLIYLPEPLELSRARLSFVTRGLLESALANDPCLIGHQGETLARNSCRSPWEHQLDLRIAHTFDVGSSDVRLSADVLNLLSLVNSEWGRVERTSPLVPLLELCQVACEGQGPLPARWGGGVLPQRDQDGRLTPSTAWIPSTPESQWRMQIGARVTLGDGR